MKQALRRKLNRLWTGELAAVVVFIFVYGSFRASMGEQIVGDYALLALVILCIILLQASAYWWLKLRQIDNPQMTIHPRVTQWAVLLDSLLLLVYPSALLIAMLNDTLSDAIPDAIVGGGIYLFAVAEFVHYAIVKLVRSPDDQRGRSQRRQVSARWMRELQRGDIRKGTR